MNWRRLSVAVAAAFVAASAPFTDGAIAQSPGAPPPVAAAPITTPEVCLADPGSQACSLARACLRAPRSTECRDGLRAQAYESAQWAVQNATAAALSRVGARFAAQNSDLGRRVTERERHATEVQTLDAELVAALGRGDTAAQTSLRARLAAAQERLEAADAYLDANYNSYQELARPKPVSIRDTQTLLAPDEALVFYMVGPQTSYVWAVSRESVEWRRIDVGENVLRRKITALRDGLNPDDVNAAVRAGRAPKFDFAASNDLYRLLIAPVSATFAAKARIVIAPSGPLLGLPFAVLTPTPPPAGAPGLGDYLRADWLGTKKAMAIIPAPSALRSLRCPAGFVNGVCAPRTGRAPPRARFIGIGAPRFNGLPNVVDQATFQIYSSCFVTGAASTPPAVDQRCIPMLNPLPGSADELRSIGGKFGVAEGQGLYTGASATEARLKGEALSANVIVIATHGLMAGSGAGTGEAGLAFTAPAMQSPARSPSALDDGYLTVSEASQLSITADFVILSACDTARGDKVEAEGLSGLARAFFYAGADALLVSHWPVADGAGMVLSPKTVEYSGTRDRAEALRLVMSEMLTSATDIRAAHPAYWAPFELVGK